MNQFSRNYTTLLKEAKVTRYGDLYVRHPAGFTGLWKYYKDPECMTLHREDGPALEYKGMSEGFKKLNEKYYLNGKKLTYNQWLIQTQLAGTDHSQKEIDDATKMLDI